MLLKLLGLQIAGCTSQFPVVVQITAKGPDRWYNGSQ